MSTRFQLDLVGQRVGGLRNAAADPATPPNGTPHAPWLFVHGAGHDSRVFAPLLDALQVLGMPAWAVDLPGHGQSDGPLQSSVLAAAQWLRQLVAAHFATGGTLRLAGHSMGSLIVLQAAAQGLALHTLALLGSTAPMRVHPALLELVRSQPAQARQRLNELSHASEVHAPEVLEELLRRNEDCLRAHQAGARAEDVLLHDLLLCDAHADALTAAGRLCTDRTSQATGAGGLRCLLISGAHDRMTPPSRAADLRAALGVPDGDCHLLAAGHNLMQEAPAALAGLLR